MQSPSVWQNRLGKTKKMWTQRLFFGAVSGAARFVSREFLRALLVSRAPPVRAPWPPPGVSLPWEPSLLWEARRDSSHRTGLPAAVDCRSSSFSKVRVLHRICSYVNASCEAEHDDLHLLSFSLV
jgi:hypothetical protein